MLSVLAAWDSIPAHIVLEENSQSVHPQIPTHDLAATACSKDRELGRRIR